MTEIRLDLDPDTLAMLRSGRTQMFAMARSPDEARAAARERQRRKRAREADGTMVVAVEITADQRDRLVWRDLLDADWKDSAAAVHMAVRLLIEQHLGADDDG